MEKRAKKWISQFEGTFVVFLKASTQIDQFVKKSFVNLNNFRNKGKQGFGVFGVN